VTEMLLIDFIIEQEVDHPITAALALIKLREAYALSDPADLAEDEKTWRGFITKHLPFGYDRATALLGTMIHRGGLLRCRKCLAEAKCACGCGAVYDPVVPEWMGRSSLERAVDAIEAAPHRSNRDLAKELAVDRRTLAKARKIVKAAHAPPNAPPQKSPG
jgi:hypothetical protein